MNREEIMAYLESVQNLETLQYCYSRKITSCNTTIKKMREDMQVRFSSLETLTIVGLIISPILVLFALASFIYSDIYAQGVYLEFYRFSLRYIIPSFFLIIAIIVFLACSVSDLFDTISINLYEKRRAKEIDKKKPQLLSEIEKEEAQLRLYSQELSSVRKLLAEAYAFNVIPAPFRNLPSVVYIYHYMSSSQQSFETAVMHSHIEAGIKEISGKLDVIIEQNMEMIKLSRTQLISSYETMSKLNQISTNVSLNRHLTSVHNYYSTSQLL